MQLKELAKKAGRQQLLRATGDYFQEDTFDSNYVSFPVRPLSDLLPEELLDWLGNDEIQYVDKKEEEDQSSCLAQKPPL